MNAAAAERWTVISAATVAGVYAYLRWQGKSKADPGTFATAWGVTYFTIALIGASSPGIGGAFAILVMTGDLLANAPALVDVIRSAGIDTTGKTAGPGRPTGGDPHSANPSAAAAKGQRVTPQNPAGVPAHGGTF